MSKAVLVTSKEVLVTGKKNLQLANHMVAGRYDNPIPTRFLAPQQIV
jgi:hypothetical protein